MIRLMAAAVLLAVTLIARAGSEEWLDLESRIQYGYYTEDARSVQRLADTLAAQPGADPLRDYYLGLAGLRLAQLNLTRDAAHARDFLEQCAARLDEALRAQGESAEGLALEASCLRMLGELSAVRAPFAYARSRSQMHRALTLAPNNPRVLLLEGLAEEEQARSSSGTGGQALATLQRSVAAFEHERAGLERPPSWGGAEAYAALARIYLTQRNAVAAREALEHSLLLAPDFAYARRLMSRIVSG